jgi:rubrerythrin
MNTKFLQFIFAVLVAGLLADCAVTRPAPLPQNNAADPQARVPVNTPNNVLARDEVTVAIQKELSQSESTTKSAETMQHAGHGDMKVEDDQGMAPATDVESEKKTVADEMKKTSEEMKKTSEEMKEKSETNSQAFYYTCPLHPQIHADKPGKCPICGMTLIKKEGVPPK